MNTRETCGRGHPLDEANSYHRNGKISCRMCNRIAVAKYKKRKPPSGGPWLRVDKDADLLVALREDLSYDPVTGEFRRTREVSSNARVGSIAGALHRNGYRYIGLRGRSYRACRLAWLYMTGSWPVALVDHANCDTADDRWENLREATNSQNAANARLRRDTRTGFKGVKRLGRKWQARIGGSGQQHLGTFDTAEEAHDAYLEAAQRIYGPFARAG